VKSVIKTLDLGDKSAVAGDRSLQRALENMDKTLTTLQVKAIEAMNLALSTAPQVDREKQLFKLCLQMPEVMHECPLRDNGASSLQQSLSVLAEVWLAVHQAQLLVKPAQHVMIASVRSAICTGLENSGVRAVLEANVDALTQMRRQRKPKAKKTSKKALQGSMLTPLEAVEETN
jgi:hypothetical protein